MDLWALGLFEFDRWSLGHFGIYELDPLELWDPCVRTDSRPFFFILFIFLFFFFGGGVKFQTLPI